MVGMEKPPCEIYPRYDGAWFFNRYKVNVYKCRIGPRVLIVVLTWPLYRVERSLCGIAAQIPSVALILS